MDKDVGNVLHVNAFKATLKGELKNMLSIIGFNRVNRQHLHVFRKL